MGILERKGVKFWTRTPSYIWRAYNLAAFNVIWGAFGAFAILRKYIFQNTASVTRVIIFQPNFL